MNSPITKNLKGRKVERIYRILLNTRKRKKSWYQIAKDGEISYGWAHKILTELQNKDIIKGTIIKRPRHLLDIWSNHRFPLLYREYHVQIPKEVLKKVKMEYAFSTYFGEHLLGGYLFPHRFDIYIHEHDAAVWHAYLSNKGYVGRGNIRIMLSDEHVFWDGKKIDGWPVVSNQQLIVDLIREGGECLEAADILISRYYND